MYSHHPPFILEPGTVNASMNSEEVMAWMEDGVRHPSGMILQARPIHHEPMPKPSNALGLFDAVRDRLLLVVTDLGQVRAHASTARTTLAERGRTFTDDPDTTMLAMLYNQLVNRTLAA